MQKIIAHIDMNSYFATCEQQDHPEWRGLPVGVCEHLGGIIIAASVEAKRWGIKTGTPVWEARRLYPKIILTKTHPDRYRYYTSRFLKVFADYTDKVEKYSIDEAFLDLTEVCNVRGMIDGKLRRLDPWQEAQEIIKEIKLRMKTEVGDYITCSAGVSYSKLVAKIASDLRKPDGLVVVRPQDKFALYDKLELTDVPGIGNRMQKQLNNLGIYTLKELRDYPESQLVAKFGIAGKHLYSMGQLEGSWKENFEEQTDSKSMGHMYTIAQEFRQQRVLRPVLYKLSEMVGARLRANQYVGDNVFVHLHNPTGLCLSRGRKIGRMVDDGREIYKEAIFAIFQMLKRDNLSWQDIENQVYLVGVTVSGLVKKLNQDNLFSQQFKSERSAGLVEALDKINTKYDDFTVARVPAFLARDIIRDSVGFGRMKEFGTTFMGSGRANH
ncbi:MAG: DNA polymerase IV [Candidatus Doudnabacteria bacterium]